MTDQELEQRLRSWYQTEVPADQAAPADLRSRVATIPRPASQPWRGSARRRGVTLLAAAALTGMIVGTALVGGFLDPQPDASLVPPSDAPSTAPSPDAQQTAITKAGRIVYTRRVRLANGEGDCTTQSLLGCEHASVVISNADGSDERELVPVPSYLIAASVDGSKLLIDIPEDDRGGLFLTDASGSTPQRLDIPCEAPCYGDGAFAFSPDGSRLAFRRVYTEELEVLPYAIDTPLIAIMDLATGTVDELESTLGYGAAPSWSPDDSRLVFANHVIDADGRNFRQIAPANLFTNLTGEFSEGLSPSQWSPDGSLIVFASSNETLAPPDNSQRLSDIYVVRPDGTGLQRLTTDTIPPIATTGPGDFGADFPAWTRGGRIMFTRYPMPPETKVELWVMDPDGSNAVQLDPSDAAALTALGCVVCSYPTIDDFHLPNNAYWIPAP